MVSIHGKEKQMHTDKQTKNTKKTNAMLSQFQSLRSSLNESQRSAGFLSYSVYLGEGKPVSQLQH